MLEILYQDDHFVAINKPSGLLIHRTRLDSHATEFAVQKVRNQIGKFVFPVHRLDRPTSGILLFALDKSSAKNMMCQFSEHSISKQYLAVVRGHLGNGILDYPLKKFRDKITDEQVNQDKSPQQAFTEYQCITQTTLPIAVRPYDSSRYTLMKLTPKTGRRHQLRRHMAHLRHPIIGDTSHGDGKHNEMFRNNFGNNRLLLHASFLSFKHPETDTIIEINAPLDTSFKSLLIKIKLNLI